jgi:transcription termination factor Rho
MSAKPRKADMEEVQEAKAAAEAAISTPAPKRKPGRPRKTPLPEETPVEAAEPAASKPARRPARKAAAVEEAAAESSAAPVPARGRRTKADDEAAQEPLLTETETAEAGSEAAEDTTDEAPARNRRTPARQTRGRRGRGAAADNEEGDENQAAEADGDQGRNEQRRGRGRGSNRRPSLNYRDLQQKILPELHLLAKEVGLEDYRQMEKDELALAVLERSTEAEGLKLVKGYLEISSDGYGFLQESLLQNNTRSVIVSAGLIKQFKLRTGDFILGKARKPRDN